MDPRTLKYSREHEWVGLVDGGQALIGITDFAQSELGDIVYVDLPGPGARLRQFDRLGEIESVKSVSDLFAPVSGEVLEANAAVQERPEVVNADPYGDGWLLRIRVADRREMESLLSLDEYERVLGEQGAP